MGHPEQDRAGGIVASEDKSKSMNINENRRC